MEDTVLVYRDKEVEVTKEFTFDSCHQLKCYNGPCSRLHGHTYKLQVTVKGKLNKIGIVIDFKELKQVVEERVIKDLDHYNLNEFFKFNPTAENMVIWIYDALKVYCLANNIKLVAIKLWETPTSFAEYRGE